MNNLLSIDMCELCDGSSRRSDGRLQSLKMNAGYGKGFLAEVKSFQSGISIVVQDFLLYGDGNIRLSRKRFERRIIAFFVCISGVGLISYEKPRAFVGGKCSGIEIGGYKPALSMDVKSNTPVRTINVCMEPDVFKRLTGKSREELVDDLDFIDWSAGKKHGPTRFKSIDYAQKMCGYQAFASFLNNSMDTLLLEAKALEMIALQLKQLDVLTGKKTENQAAHRPVEKITQACEILTKEMANPPKARELARRVGLNHNQLVHGFKEILGVNPFEYLRIIRLEKAYHLISGHECNITEAAFSVGYSSLSHFTKTFREEFGMNPSEI